MNADLSRRVGNILGHARPAPTPQEREQIAKALQEVEAWSQLPTRIRQMLNYMRSTAGNSVRIRESR